MERVSCEDLSTLNEGSELCYEIHEMWKNSAQKTVIAYMMRTRTQKTVNEYTRRTITKKTANAYMIQTRTKKTATAYMIRTRTPPPPKKKTTAAYMLRTRTKKTVNEYMIWTRTKKTVTKYTRRTRTKKMTDSGASFTTLFGFRVFTWWSFFCSSVYAWPSLTTLVVKCTCHPSNWTRFLL
jgi:hypothetical protein